jgi:hypothetical protein
MCYEVVVQCLQSASTNAIHIEHEWQKLNLVNKMIRRISLHVRSNERQSGLRPKRLHNNNNNNKFGAAN